MVPRSRPRYPVNTLRVSPSGKTGGRGGKKQAPAGGRIGTVTRGSSGTEGRVPGLKGVRRPRPETGRTASEKGRGKMPGDGDVASIIGVRTNTIGRQSDTKIGEGNAEGDVQDPQRGP